MTEVKEEESTGKCQENVANKTKENVNNGLFCSTHSLVIHCEMTVKSES